MKQLLISIVCLFGVLMVTAAGTIRFKTTINRKLLPPMFPADAAVAWTNLYYDSSHSLLASNCKEINWKKIDPEQTDYFTFRNRSNKGQIAKWINGKWINTSNEYEYHLQKVQSTRTKIICGYSCYAVTFSDNENGISSTGWVANALPVNQGIRLVHGSKGALLAYENEKEATYATKIEATIPANWTAIYEQVKIAVTGQTLQLNIPATGERKPVVIGQLFPSFLMMDVKAATWNNTKLIGHTTLLAVWGDLEAISFPNGTFSETDFEFLQRLEVMLQRIGSKVHVIAPTFTGRAELLQKHPESKKFTSVSVVPDAENWMSNQVKIKKFPTLIVVNKKGIVTHRFEFSHTKEEYNTLEKLVQSL